jgi:ribosomal-protein-alanine N-acetyltransferase
MSIVIRRVELSEIIDLRHRVLRAGLPREEAIFSGDEAATAMHFAAYSGDDVVGCATIHLNEWQGEPAYQLRGMAVDFAKQGAGIGQIILVDVYRVVQESGIKMMWANCRIGAIRFYERQGWEYASEEFEIPKAGAHFRMTKRL